MSCFGRVGACLSGRLFVKSAWRLQIAVHKVSATATLPTCHAIARRDQRSNPHANEKRVKVSHFNANVSLRDSLLSAHTDQKKPIDKQKKPMCKKRATFWLFLSTLSLTTLGKGLLKDLFMNNSLRGKSYCTIKYAYSTFVLDSSFCFYYILYINTTNVTEIRYLLQKDSKRKIPIYQ